MTHADNLSPEEREDLIAYLDGELDDETTQRLETKISQNAAARTEIEELKRSWALLDVLPRPQASEQFTNRTMDRLATVQLASARRSRFRRWLVATGWAASLIVAGVGGYWTVAHWPKPTPIEPAAEDRRLMEHKEYWHHYENVESVDFLKALERSEIFNEDL